MTNKMNQCQDCGSVQYGPGWTEIVVPKNIWDDIRPSKGTLCMACARHRLAEAGYANVKGFIRTAAQNVYGPFDICCP